MVVMTFSEEGLVAHDGELYVPVRLEAIRVNTTPDFDLYFRPGPAQPLVLYCERSVPFTEETRDRLKNTPVECFYIHQDYKRQYNRYLDQHLEDILQDPELDVRKKAEILYDSALATVERILLEPPSKENIERGKAMVRQAVAFMNAQDFPLEHLLRHISCDYYLYSHSVNVMAYSIALARRIGHRDVASLREMANGALLHDIGMGMVGPELYRKEGALTPLEREKVKTHPSKGRQALLEIGNLGEIALDIVMHHHERLDGSGYPDRLRGDALSPFVRIVAIADTFDALTTDRPYQPRRKTFPALSLMQREMPQQIDMALFRSFVEIMGGTP